MRPFSSSDKWTASIIAGLIFVMLSSPWAYSWSSKMPSGDYSRDGFPPLACQLAHALAFGLVIRLIMPTSKVGEEATEKDKFIYATVAGFAFIVFSSSLLLDALEAIGLPVREGGRTTVLGLATTGVLFVGFVRLLMR